MNANDSDTQKKIITRSIVFFQQHQQKTKPMNVAEMVVECAAEREWERRHTSIIMNNLDFCFGLFVR